MDAARYCWRPSAALFSGTGTVWARAGAAASGESSAAAARAIRMRIGSGFRIWVWRRKSNGHPYTPDRRDVPTRGLSGSLHDPGGIPRVQRVVPGPRRRAIRVRTGGHEACASNNPASPSAQARDGAVEGGAAGEVLVDGAQRLAAAEEEARAAGAGGHLHHHHAV